MRMNINPVKWFTSTSIKQEVSHNQELGHEVKLLKAKNLISSNKVAKLESLNHKSMNEFGIPMFGGNNVHAGVRVNTATAIETDIVYTCIRDKAESIGQLPLVIKRNGKRLERGSREHRIFSMKPNDYMTTQDLLEMYVTNMELHGNFYMLPVLNKFGNIAELIPFRFQTNVKPSMDTNGRVYYTYSTNDGKPNIAFAGNTLIHIKLNSLNGYDGLSPISAAAMVIGVAISQEQHIASLMEKGARPSGVLTTDAIFKDPDAIKRLKHEWGKTHGGAGNSGKTAVLENGLKYQAMGLSPADSELIKQRIFSRIQICGVFRVPPSRVGVVDAQKYSKLEDNNKAYLRDSLIPLITKFENALNSILPTSLLVEIDVSQYARGDRLSQVEALSAELKSGGIMISEMREDLGRPFVDGSEVFAIDTNNLTFGLLTDIPKLQAAALEREKAANQKPAEIEVETDE